MLRSASTEFVALCRSQISLLTQAWGASVGAVYLTEDLAPNSQTELIPIAIYPDNIDLGAASGQWSLVAAANVAPMLPLKQALPSEVPASPEEPTDRPFMPENTDQTAIALQRQQRLVLPLIHDDLVLGFLVVGRPDRPWNAREREQLEEIAHTLAIASVLDQRYQWLEDTTYHQRLQNERRLALQTQQQDILANLLHQLRNPLTALRTLGKLLLKRLVLEDDNRSLALSIVQESDRMDQLLQQFDAAIDLGEATLDASPVPVTSPRSPLLLPGTSSTGAALQLQPCWLADILAPLLQSGVAIASERHLDLQIQIPPHLPPVRADIRALREVCSNLLDNALKYTPAGGQVCIQVSREPATSATGYCQEITLSDTGPGIPVQDLEHIFERHYRGIQAQGEIPGTGLGLAIARELIAQMQGQIQVFSPALGREDCQPSPSPLGPGSSFVVILPEQLPDGEPEVEP